MLAAHLFAVGSDPQSPVRRRFKLAFVRRLQGRAVRLEFWSVALGTSGFCFDTRSS